MLTRSIKACIEEMPQNVVFSYRDLSLKESASATVVRTLNRMVERGELTKLSKGRYYKPRVSSFGTMLPNREEFIKDLLWANGRTIGYITGYLLFLQMGLTTQVPNILEIGINGKKNAIERGIYKIRFVSQPNKITSANTYLLQLLDCLKYIRNIPDTTIDKSVALLANKIMALETDKKNRLLILGSNYQPFVRALLGAIMEQYCPEVNVELLKKSLNPVSTYKIGISILSNAKNWNIR